MKIRHSMGDLPKATGRSIDAAGICSKGADQWLSLLRYAANGALFVANPIEVYPTRAAACIKGCRSFASAELVPMGLEKPGRKFASNVRG